MSRGTFSGPQRRAILEPASEGFPGYRLTERANLERAGWPRRKVELHACFLCAPGLTDLSSVPIERPEVLSLRLLRLLRVDGSIPLEAAYGLG